MKILKIEDKKGFFYDFNKKDYCTVDRISSELLAMLVDFIFKNEDSEIDEYKENCILNKAQDIVYKDLYIKLNDLINNRVTILNDIQDKYKKAMGIAQKNFLRIISTDAATIRTTIKDTPNTPNRGA